MRMNLKGCLCRRLAAAEAVGEERHVQLEAFYKVLEGSCTGAVWPRVRGRDGVGINNQNTVYTTSRLVVAFFRWLQTSTFTSQRSDSNTSRFSNSEA